MAKSFDEIKKYYEELYFDKQGDSFPFDLPRTKFVTDTFKKFTPAANAPKALDIGCGAGYACSLMIENGYSAYGVDISQQALDLAKSRIPEGTFLPASEDGKLSFDADYFSAVLCLGVLEHIINPEAVIQEAFRVLKIGGTAVFLVPNSLSLYFLFSKGTGQIMEVPRTKQEWGKMFTNSGFEIDSVKKDPGPTIQAGFSLTKRLKIILNRTLNLLPADFTYQFIFVLHKK